MRKISPISRRPDAADLRISRGLDAADLLISRLYHTSHLPAPISPYLPLSPPISPGYYTCLLRYQHEDFAGAAAACDAALRSGACDGSAASRYGEMWGRYGEMWGDVGRDGEMCREDAGMRPRHGRAMGEMRTR